MELSDCGVQFIASFEGFSSTAYWDATGHVWTIGFGTTDPTHAYQGASCTREEALKWLGKEVSDRDLPAVRGLPYAGQFNQHQVDALVSFAYNLGPHIFDAGHDIRTALDGLEWEHGDWSRLDHAIHEYDRSGGQALPGLTRRRTAEAHLFETGDYGFPCSPTKAPKPQRREDDER